MIAPRSASPGASRRDLTDRGIHEIGLVVPRIPERRAHGPADADEVVRTRPRAGQRVERVGVATRELAVRRDQGLLGGRVLGDRCEPPGLACEDPADRRCEHGCGHRTAARAGEPGRAEQFGHSVEGEERDASDAVPAARDRAEAPAGELAPHRDAHVVGGHDHGHRCERVVLLRPRDRITQRLGRRWPVGRADAFDRHPRGSYGGGVTPCRRSAGMKPRAPRRSSRSAPW